MLFAYWLATNKKDSLPYPKKNWEWLNLHGKVKTMEAITQVMSHCQADEKEGSTTVSTTISFNTDGYIEQIKYMMVFKES